MITIKKEKYIIPSSIITINVSNLKDGEIIEKALILLKDANFTICEQDMDRSNVIVINLEDKFKKAI